MSDEPKTHTPTTLVLNRDGTLVTTKGHTLTFKKGVPLHVPPIVYQEALHFGAQPPAGMEIQVRDEAPADVAPVGVDERRAVILSAIETLYSKHSRDRYSFSASGNPTSDAVSKIVGFRVQNAEVVSVMQAYHLKRSQQVD